MSARRNFNSFRRRSNGQQNGVHSSGQSRYTFPKDLSADLAAAVLAALVRFHQAGSRTLALPKAMTRQSLGEIYFRGISGADEDPLQHQAAFLDRPEGALAIVTVSFVIVPNPGLQAATA